jgi:hypothetical protein
MLLLHSIKKRSAPAAWLLTVLLMFAPLGRHAAAAVLCFGADGHIATELAEGTACITSATHAPAHDPSDPEAAVTDNHTGGTHCGPCTDVPLPTGGDADCASFKTESGPTAQMTLSVVALLPMLHHLQAAFSAARQAGDRQPPRPSDTSFVRSVVLLI